ncbi:MAG: dTDP-4-dehydrorhamnose reductase [Spirochaetota bacterium]
MQSKVLITGANGQLGYEFRKLFSENSVPFLATDFAELDITNEKKIKEFFQNNTFEYIINCAAYNDVDRAERDKDACFALNAHAPLYLATVAKEQGGIFVTYSTDFVFDGKRNRPYVEEDLPNPMSVYAKSKLKGEQNVLNTYNKVFIIRTSWLFGIAGKNFNTQVLEWAKQKKELKIVDDQISSPTYAKDLAYFSWLLIQTQHYGLYHFSNEGIASKFDQAEYLLKKTGWTGVLNRAKTSDFNLPAQRPAYSKLDSSKIKKIVGKEIKTWQNAIDRWFTEWKIKNKELI